LKQRLHRCRITNVGGHGKYPFAGRHRFGDGLVQGIFTAAWKNDRATLVQKRKRHGPANSGARASDDGDFVFSVIASSTSDD